jgi:predicted Rossmann-fold nucleotide-binding protein
MKRISVFCGSSPGKNGIYEKSARQLGEILAERKIGLVYGGTNIGLMNHVADGALRRGGEVIGVLPEFIGKRNCSCQSHANDNGKLDA